MKRAVGGPRRIVAVDPGRGGVDPPAGPRISFADVERVALRSWVVHELPSVRRPRDLGCLQERPKRATQRRHRPHVDGLFPRSRRCANPQVDERSVRREGEVAQLFVGELGGTALREIVKGPRADLAHPGVHRAVPGREKSDEFAVPRDGAVQLSAVEVGDPGELGARQGVPPARSLEEPGGRASREQHGCCHHPPPGSTPGRERGSVRGGDSGRGRLGAARGELLRDLAQLDLHVRHVLEAPVRVLAQAAQDQLRRAARARPARARSVAPARSPAIAASVVLARRTPANALRPVTIS